MIWIRQRFLKYDTRSTGNKRKKIHKLNFIIIRKLGESKGIVKRTKRPPTEWEKMFENHISEKGLIFRLYEQFLQLSNNKKTNPIQKWAKDIFPKIQMATKHVKRC